jgi:HSP20 family protein
MQDLAAMFNESFFGGTNNNDNNNNNNNNDNSEERGTQFSDFKPEADVFDTLDSYVIHINLPGAKKEDVGVNWDAEKSELNVAGVIHRPGDEEFLKTLALDERKVGAFERKVRLGSRANPAVVDVEGITAKLEDGVLRVTVPKMNGEFVEVRKVDVE